MLARRTATVALLLPVLLGSSRITTVAAQITQLEAALEFFRIDNARYPTTEEGLRALVSPPPALAHSYRQGGYLQRGVVPTDPWGNSYQYLAPGRHNPTGFDLWSLGADGLSGGTCLDADIGNWKSPTPGILGCPRQNPLVQQAILAALATAVLGIVALVLLAGFRSFHAIRHKRTWLSVVSPPPLALVLTLAAIFLLLLLGVESVP